MLDWSTLEVVFFNDIQRQADLHRAQQSLPVPIAVLQDTDAMAKTFTKLVTEHFKVNYSQVVRTRALFDLGFAGLQQDETWFLKLFEATVQVHTVLHFSAG